MSLRAQGVSVDIRQRQILADITCTVAAGELVVLLGPNGCGKTTLVKALAGDLRPTKGTVMLNQLALSKIDSKELARQRAVLPQHASLDFPFTVHEVVSMGRSPHLTTRHENEAIIDDVLSELDLTAFAQRRYLNLSGGEKQRVQIARVLAQIWECPSNAEAAYLLLDEPDSALDLSHQYALFDFLRKRQRSTPLAIIASLHDLNLAARFASRIVLMQSGEIVADGAPQDVLTQSRIEAVFNIQVVVGRHPEISDIPLIVPM